MSSPEQMLNGFHDKYDLGLGDGDFSDEGDRTERLKIVEEEINEWLAEMEYGTDPDKALKETCDLVVTLVGTCTKFGWPFDKAFRRVMLSNMTKGNRDGTHTKKQGKLQKGEMYKPPKMDDLV